MYFTLEELMILKNLVHGLTLNGPREVVRKAEATWAAIEAKIDAKIEAQKDTIPAKE